MLVSLCELVVKKDRITTITILDRPPRCQCRNAAGTDPPANRTCVASAARRRLGRSRAAHGMLDLCGEARL